MTTERTPDIRAMSYREYQRKESKCSILDIVVTVLGLSAIGLVAAGFGMAAMGVFLISAAVLMVRRYQQKQNIERFTAFSEGINSLPIPLPNKTHFPEEVVVDVERECQKQVTTDAPLKSDV